MEVGGVSERAIECDQTGRGAQAGVLGFNYLTTLGAGLELDTTAHEVYVTRVRAVVRYVFGNNVSGVSLGLAASF